MVIKRILSGIWSLFFIVALFIAMFGSLVCFVLMKPMFTPLFSGLVGTFRAMGMGPETSDLITSWLFIMAVLGAMACYPFVVSRWLQWSFNKAINYKLGRKIVGQDPSNLRI